MNLTKFCAASNIPSSLIRAVVRQSRGWESFIENASDIYTHGAQNGFGGWCYHRETVTFAKRVKNDIMALAEAQARDFGSDVYEMIGNFNCLKISAGEVGVALNNSRSDDHINVYNALAWYALEEVSRSYCDLKGEPK